VAVVNPQVAVGPLITPGVATVFVTASVLAAELAHAEFDTTLMFPDVNVLVMSTLMEVPVLEVPVVIFIPAGKVHV